MAVTKNIGRESIPKPPLFRTLKISDGDLLYKYSETSDAVIDSICFLADPALSTIPSSIKSLDKISLLLLPCPPSSKKSSARFLWSS